MANRQSLQEKLLELVGEGNKVYFQPGPTVKMDYPCIVYSRSNYQTDFADDVPYRVRDRWQVTVMDRNPDSVIPRKVANLPMCVSDRNYQADQVNHFTFNLYF